MTRSRCRRAAVLFAAHGSCSAPARARAKKVAEPAAPRRERRSIRISCSRPLRRVWRRRRSRPGTRSRGSGCRRGTCAPPNANFNAALKEAPAFYPSEAGLGYVALARNDNKAAASHFDRALARQRGVRAGARRTRRGAADARRARAGSPQLRGGPRRRPSAVGAPRTRRRPPVSRRSRTTSTPRARRRRPGGSTRRARLYPADDRRVARERVPLSRARRRRAHARAIWRPALEHARKAVKLNPSEPRNFVTIAEILEAQGDYAKAAEAYGAASGDRADRRRSTPRSTRCASGRRSPRCRPSTKSIETSPTVTRAQLAALLGVRLGRPAPPRPARQRRRPDRHARQLGRAVDPVRLARRRDGGVSRTTRSSRTPWCAAGISPRRSAACAGAHRRGEPPAGRLVAQRPRPVFRSGPGTSQLPGGLVRGRIRRDERRRATAPSS